jgi:hypothetical protein
MGRIDEIAGRFDTLLSTGELDTLFLGADAPSVAARGGVCDGVALVSFTASV